MPARRQRPGLRLAVADHAGDRQIRVVEGRSEGVRQRVAELAALVDRPGRLGRGVARDAARERELAEEPLQPALVAADLRVELAVGALEVGVGHDAGPAVTGAGHVQHVEVARDDEPVEVRPDEIQAGCRAPVAEQAGLDVLGRERLAQQRVAEQVDLPDREVVRGAPPGVDQPQLVALRAGRPARLRKGHRGQPSPDRELEARWSRAGYDWYHDPRWPQLLAGDAFPNIWKATDFAAHSRRTFRCQEPHHGKRHAWAELPRHVP